MRGPLIRRIQTTTASMDDSLRLIQHLYGEDVDDPAFDHRLTEDDALREEYEQLQETKDALDRRSSPSPAPTVVDDIVEQAADAAKNGPASSPSDRAANRPAQAPKRAWTQRLQGASAALAVLLIVGLGWWQLRSYSPESSTASTTPSSTKQQSASAATGTEQDPEARSIPEWDDRDEMVRLHQRIQQLRSRSGADAWGSGLQTVDQTTP